MHDCGSIRIDGRRRLLQRRLVATGHGASGQQPRACAGAGHCTGTDRATADCKLLHDARSVRRDGRRHLLQRRLAATRHGASGQQPCAGSRSCTGIGTGTGAGTGADRTTAECNFMHDVRSVCRHRRRRLLQRRVAAPRHGRSRRQPGASAGVDAGPNSGARSGTDADAVTCRASAERQFLHDVRSVRRHGRRHLLQRRLAAPRHGGARRQPGTGAGADVGSVTRRSSGDLEFLHDTRSVRRVGRRHLP
jgi:hypothetical protein